MCQICFISFEYNFKIFVRVSTFYYNPKKAFFQLTKLIGCIAEAVMFVEVP